MTAPTVSKAGRYQSGLHLLLRLSGETCEGGGQDTGDGYGYGIGDGTGHG